LTANTELSANNNYENKCYQMLFIRLTLNETGREFQTSTQTM